MGKQPESATLVIFSLGPERERARRRLLPGAWREVELRLHRQGLETALEAGRASGCRVAVSAPEDLDLPVGVEWLQQTGRTFGERLGHALDAVWRARPEGPVVIVGSDVPGLTANHLHRAQMSLEEDPDRVVVGPSPDGGFYLLASRRPVEDLFQDVRWRRPDTLASLLELLASAGRPVELLPALADLDHRADLERWLSAPDATAGSWRELCGLLRSILSAFRRPAALPRIGWSQRPAVAAAGPRAPPG